MRRWQLVLDSRVPQLTCIWMSIPGESGFGNLTSTWWYWVTWGHLCLYILHKMEICSSVSDALLNDWLTDFERWSYSASYKVQGWSSRNAITLKNSLQKMSCTLFYKRNFWNTEPLLCLFQCPPFLRSSCIRVNYFPLKCDWFGIGILLNWIS